MNLLILCLPLAKKTGRNKQVGEKIAPMLITASNTVFQFSAEFTVTVQGTNPKQLVFDASKTTYFKFWAKGPSNAIIMLAQNATFSQNENHHRVVIGGNYNKKAWIRRLGTWGQDTSPIAYGSFLSTTEYHPFWISWANHNITFGRGQQIGIDVVCFKDTTSHPIDTNYLFVMSHSSHTVHFKYFYYNGNLLCFL